MKKVLSLVLVLSMVLSMFSFASASTLKDVTGTKYEAAVEALMELKVVGGYPDGTFLPEKVVTRAELAKLLVTAYGLEQAAEVATGATPFRDTDEAPWAAGYINVAADYKFVNGYPDGTFRPNDTVTYAEAITMCLRVLGYTNEIDSKGTWPTNYIAKAQDLKLMKDIEYKSYNDGAQRGNVAILIWNMLRTEMWEVLAESEGDGLHSQPNREMLNVKFSDYRYIKDATFYGYNFEEDSDSKDIEPKVTMFIENDLYDFDGLEYLGNDFYTFVPGTEVEALINVEDEVLLTIVPTSNNNLVSGTKEEIDDKYEELRDIDYDYAYTLVKGKRIVGASVLTGESLYIDKVETAKSGKSITLNSNKTYKFDDYDGEVFLEDGKRVTLRDLEKGDILTAVSVGYVVNGNGDGADGFYVIGGSEEDGKLTKYVEEVYDKSDVGYIEITVGGEKYKLDRKATYVEDPSKTNVNAIDFTSDIYNKKMNGEEVTIKLDPMFGKVVRVEFDGKIDGGDEETSIKFVAVTSEVNYDSDARSYSIDLETEDGALNSKGTKFAKAKTGKKFDDPEVEIAGAFAVVELDDDDEINDLGILAIATEDGYDYSGDCTIVDGDDTYAVELMEAAKYDKDKKAIVAGDNEMAVGKNTVVAVLTYDDKGTTTEKDDECLIEFQGADTATKIKDEDVVVIYKAGLKATEAKYVLIFDNVSTKSDQKVGVVDRWYDNNIGSKNVDILDGEEDLVDNEMKVALSEGDVVVYTTKDGKNDKVEFNLVSSLINIPGDDFAYVSVPDEEENLTDRKVLLDEQVFDLDDDSETDFSEFTFVEVSVYYDDDDVVTDNARFVDFDDVTLNDGDRIEIDDEEDVFYVIRGLEKRS